MKLTKRELEQMINESVRKVLETYNYKNGLNRLRAICHAKGLSDEETNEYVRKCLAKRAAISDINSEIRSRRRRALKNAEDYFEDPYLRREYLEDIEFNPIVNSETFDNFR